MFWGDLEQLWEQHIAVMNSNLEKKSEKSERAGDHRLNLVLIVSQVIGLLRRPQMASRLKTAQTVIWGF